MALGGLETCRRLCPLTGSKRTLSRVQRRDETFKGFDKPCHELDSKPAGNYCQSRRTNEQKNADDELEATLLPVGQDRNDTLAHN